MTIKNGDDLLKKAELIIDGNGTTEEKMMAICDLLKNKVDHYNWVGFYLVDPEEEKTLVLGPYAGAPTDHTRIPFGSGICGQAAEKEEPFVIQDVSREENYLSCSIDVRSEIVLPIFKDGEVIGELDIDSHHLSPFTEDDSRILSRVCDLISTII